VGEGFFLLDEFRDSIFLLNNADVFSRDLSFFSIPALLGRLFILLVSS